MALVVTEIAETSMWVEQDVLVPRVAGAVHLDRASLEADHLPGVIVPGAARAERDVGVDRFLELCALQDVDVGIFRIEDGAATRARHDARMRERTELDGGAAVAAVEALGDGRDGYHPSKVRT